MNLYDLHNSFRIEYGLDRFQLSPELMLAAEKQAKWMARRNWLYSYNTTKRHILLPYNNITEHITTSHSAEAAFKSWVNDYDSRRMVLSNWQYMGHGFHQSRKGYFYWCVLIGDK